MNFINHSEDPALILPTDHEIHSTSITHLQSTVRASAALYHPAEGANQSEAARNQFLPAGPISSAAGHRT